LFVGFNLWGKLGLNVGIEIGVQYGKKSSMNRLQIVTFGFKYGTPNTNYYFDVSFLKNPAREAKWGLFSAPSEEMREFVLRQEEAQIFLDKLQPLVLDLIKFDEDVRIGLGCNAGRHRSVILAEELYRRLQNENLDITIIHREH